MTARPMLTLFAFALVTATIAFSQSPTEPLALALNPSDTWQAAQQVGASKRKLFVVTFDNLDRRQACRVRSFTAEKLVCSRGIGGLQTYLPQQIFELILPGDGRFSKLRLMLGLNAGLGAAIWGTVVLAATCPACAVATGIAAFFCFGAAGAILIADDQPDKVFYHAPSRQLSQVP